MTPNVVCSSSQALDAMLMPPPSKKQRHKVDLSYVAPGQGVGFVLDSFEPERALSQHDEERGIFGAVSGHVGHQLTIVSQEEELSQQSHVYLTQQQSECDDEQELGIEERDSSTNETHHEEQSRVQPQELSNNPNYSDQQEQTPDDVTNFDFTTVQTSLRDIIGHENAKVRIDEILLPLAVPASITSSILVGVRAMPASILMYGPPGCGKTQLARAIAGESQAAFVTVGPSQVLSKYVGESESCIQALFTQARRAAMRTESKCSVVFFDEIDALGMSRSAHTNGGVSRNILTELLIQLSNLAAATTQVDGDDSRVIVVAATNRLEDCDEALVRRFAIQLSVMPPKFRDRCKIFRKFFRDFAHKISKENLKELAQATEGWSGSDLESFVREAAMTPVRECLRKAAVKKRDVRKRLEQNKESCRQAAKDVLVEGFQNLRPVTIQDFRDAMRFFVGDGEGADDSNNSGTGSCYDSDSSHESDMDP